MCLELEWAALTSGPPSAFLGCQLEVCLGCQLVCPSQSLSWREGLGAQEPHSPSKAGGPKAETRQSAGRCAATHDEPAGDGRGEPAECRMVPRHARWPCEGRESVPATGQVPHSGMPSAQNILNDHATAPALSLERMSEEVRVADTSRLRT